MKTFFKWLLLAPVALVVLVFAVVNRHSTSVVLDPLGLMSEGMTISAPLFIILFLALALGVLVGGFAAWIAQGKHRREAREALADLRIMREESRARTEEVARLRTGLAALPAPANDTRNAA
jgi:uncharacterized integral membrane protein